MLITTVSPNFSVACRRAQIVSGGWFHPDSRRFELAAGKRKRSGRSLPSAWAVEQSGRNERSIFGQPSLRARKGRANSNSFKSALETESDAHSLNEFNQVIAAFRSLKTVDLELRPVSIGPHRGCAPTSCSACWPIICNGTCARASPRCCSTSPIRPRARHSAPRRWQRPSPHRRRNAKPPANAPTP